MLNVIVNVNEYVQNQNQNLHLLLKIKILDYTTADMRCNSISDINYLDFSIGSAWKALSGDVGL